MEYLKIDPLLDSHPEVMEAGFWGARFFEFLLRVSAKHDLHGRIPPKFQQPKWLARTWGLTDKTSSIHETPENLVLVCRDDALSGGLLAREGEDWLIPGWDRFYEYKKTNAERQAEYRERKRSHSSNGVMPVVTVTTRGNSNATSHHITSLHKEEKEDLSTKPETTPSSIDLVSVVGSTKHDKEVREVFEHWVAKTERHPTRTKLSEKRKQLIRARLKEGHTAETLKLAIDGNQRSKWHQGENDRKAVFDDIELILRDTKQVEDFSERAENYQRRQATREAGAKAVASVAQRNLRPERQNLVQQVERDELRKVRKDGEGSEPEHSHSEPG